MLHVCRRTLVRWYTLVLWRMLERCNTFAYFVGDVLKKKILRFSVQRSNSFGLR